MITSILSAIPKQQFEHIRNRILEILVLEFDTQNQLTYDNDLDLSVFIERSIPLNSVQENSINITLAQGIYDNKNQGNQDGLYIFYIDVYTKAASYKDSKGREISGDVKAAVMLHKILGVARAILEDPIYKTLGVKPPFIMKSFISEMNIRQIDTKDALSTSMGRLTFNVKANESSKLLQPVLIEGYQTNVQIDESGQGYFWDPDQYQ